MIKRILWGLWFLALASRAFGQATPATIVDTLYNPNGSKATCTLYISNPAFLDSTNHLVPANTIQSRVTNGALSVSLVPTTTAITLNTFYTVRYACNDGPSLGATSEFWAVYPGSNLKLGGSPPGTPPIRVAPFVSLPGAWIATINNDGAQLQTIGSSNDTNVTLLVSDGGGGVHTLVMGWQGTLAAGRLNSNVVQAITNDTNVTGSITAQNLTLGWAGQLAEGRGGTGASSFTQGSVVFAGASVLSQNNTHLFWDATNNRLGINQGTSLLYGLDVGAGGIRFYDATAVTGATTIAIRNGANQTANPLIQFFHNDGTSDSSQISWDGTRYVANFAVFQDNTQAVALNGTQGLIIGSAESVLFTTTNSNTGTVDVRFHRSSANTLQLDNGSGGNAVLGVTGQLLLSNLAGGGTLCLQVNNSGFVSAAASACGGGSGSGTVNNGTATHLAYYASPTNAVSDAGADLVFDGTHTYSSASTLIFRIGTAAHTAPEQVGTTAGKPATCTIGDMYFANDATAGQNNYYCTSSNVWTQQLNSGTAGITALTTDVTATGPGSVAATVVQIEGGVIPTSATIVGTNGSKQLVATALSSASIFVGSAGNLPVGVSVSGDASITNAGAVTVSKVNNGAVPTSATVAATNGSNQIVAAALANTDIYVGNASNLPVAVAVSGDATLANTGAVTVTKVNGGSIPTSATALASNGSNQIIAATLQGNGAKVQLSTGATVTNDCVKFDANGNTVDAGAGCAGGAGLTGFANSNTSTILTILNGIGACGGIPINVSTTGTVTLGASSAAAGSQLWVRYDCVSQALIVDFNSNMTPANVTVSNVTKGVGNATGFANGIPIVSCTAGAVADNYTSCTDWRTGFQANQIAAGSGVSLSTDSKGTITITNTGAGGVPSGTAGQGLWYASTGSSVTATAVTLPYNLVGPGTTSCPSTSTALNNGSYTFPAAANIGVGDEIEATTWVTHANSNGSSATASIFFAGADVQVPGGLGIPFTFSGNQTYNIKAIIQVISSTQYVVHYQSTRDGGGGSTYAPTVTVGSIGATPTISVNGASCTSGDTLQMQAFSVVLHKAVTR